MPKLRASRPRYPRLFRYRERARWCPRNRPMPPIRVASTSRCGVLGARCRLHRADAGSRLTLAKLGRHLMSGDVGRDEPVEVSAGDPRRRPIRASRSLPLAAVRQLRRASVQGDDAAAPSRRLPRRSRGWCRVRPLSSMSGRMPANTLSCSHMPPRRAGSMPSSRAAMPARSCASSCGCIGSPMSRSCRWRSAPYAGSKP